MADTNTTTIPATTKKTPAKKNAKKTPAPAKVVGTKKEGLRKPQIRILACLAKSKTPLTRNQIAEKAPVDLAMQNSYIGSNDPEIRAKNDAKVMPSLLTLKYIKVEQHDIDGRDTCVYSITAAGAKALKNVAE